MESASKMPSSYLYDQ
ncbi:TPA: hypothetical protein ACF2VI_002723 [Escherichia coli]